MEKIGRTHFFVGAKFAVTTAEEVPTPTPKLENIIARKVTLDVQIAQMPLDEAFRSIAREAALHVSLDASVVGEARNFSSSGLAPLETLQAAAKFFGCRMQCVVSPLPDGTSQNLYVITRSLLFVPFKTPKLQHRLHLFPDENAAPVPGSSNLPPIGELFGLFRNNATPQGIPFL